MARMFGIWKKLGLSTVHEERTYVLVCHVFEPSTLTHALSFEDEIVELSSKKSQLEPIGTSSSQHGSFIGHSHTVENLRWNGNIDLKRRRK